MLDSGIRINLWTNPYISPEAGFYKQILPYSGSHTVWNGLVPDLTLSPARDLFFGQLQKDQVDIGVSGYKIDEVDGYDSYLWPDVTTFPSGISAEQMRQTFGILLQRYSAALFHQRNQRTFGLIRARMPEESPSPTSFITIIITMRILSLPSLTAALPAYYGLPR